MPPPPIPPVPPSMGSVEAAEAEAAGPAAADAGGSWRSWPAKNNPTLVQARAQVETAFGMAIQAGLWPNPTLVYFALIGQGGTAGLHEVFFSQPIITAGKRRINRARFLETTKAEQWNAMAVEYRVLNDVRHPLLPHARACRRSSRSRRSCSRTPRTWSSRSARATTSASTTAATLHEANAGVAGRSGWRYLRTQNMYRRAWQQLMAVVGVQMPFTPLAGGLEGDTTPLEWDAVAATGSSTRAR